MPGKVVIRNIWHVRKNNRKTTATIAGAINSYHKQIPWTVRVQWSGKRWSSENMRRYTSPKQEWYRAHPSQRGEERSTFSQISEGNLTYKSNYTTSHPYENQNIYEPCAFSSVRSFVLIKGVHHWHNIHWPVHVWAPKRAPKTKTSESSDATASTKRAWRFGGVKLSS